MRRLALVPLGLATVLALACGAPEPEPEPEPAADETPAPPQFGCLRCPLLVLRR